MLDVRCSMLDECSPSPPRPRRGRGEEARRSNEPSSFRVQRSMLDVDVQRSALNLRGSVMVGAAVLFRVFRVVRRLQLGESWLEIFEVLNTSSNQALVPAGVSTSDEPR